MPKPSSEQQENAVDETAPPSDEQDQEDAVAEQFAQAIDQVIGDEEGSESPDELAEEKERVLRLQAEMENLRNRTSREISESARYAAMPFVRDLLPVIDNIDRAIEAAEKNAEATNLLEGFKLVHQQLVSLLEKHHCKRIEDLGEPFDPQFHEAILQQPSDEQPANHIMMVTEAGYVLHDRVVRPSKVIISSGPAPSEDKAEEE